MKNLLERPLIQIIKTMHVLHLQLAVTHSNRNEQSFLFIWRCFALNNDRRDDHPFQRPKTSLDEKQRQRVDYPRRSHREEYGAEVAPPTGSIRPEHAERTDHTPVKREEDGVMKSTGRISGYMGLAFGIASLFMWSIVLGPAAAVLGYYAYVNGRKTAGAWSIGLGAVATLSYFFMIPFAR